MKISFITTVYNEERTIGLLLESLLTQSELPEEVIIVDAKSTDNTVQVLETFIAKFKKTKFHILSKKGNRSVGRNYAIKNATGDVIVASDAGCILDKKWLGKISSPFKNRATDVTAGFYRPVTSNVFEKSLAAYTCFPKEKLNDDFLPSSRSIGFRRSVWAKVGGYPEFLDTCEDLIYAKHLKDLKVNFVVVADAIVYWPQRKNILSAFRQFFLYARGDGMARYFRPSIPFLYARYLFAIFAILLTGYYQNQVLNFFIVFFFFLYIFWAILKNYKYVGNWLAILYLPLLQFTSDFAVLLGTSIGFIASFDR